MSEFFNTKRMKHSNSCSICVPWLDLTQWIFSGRRWNKHTIKYVQIWTGYFGPFVRWLIFSEPILLSRLATRLVRDSVFHLAAGDNDLPTQHCLISLIGWCSLLFIPSRNISDGAFDLDTQGAKCFKRTSIALESAQRPIDELLRSFGELLPNKRIGTKHSTKAHGSLKFHVSNLNISTLKKLAGVKIVWVDTMSAHLDFDPTTATLCIFKAPSYCKLNSSGDTFPPMLIFILPHQTYSNTFTRTTKDFYTEEGLK